MKNLALRFLFRVLKIRRVPRMVRYCAMSLILALRPVMGGAAGDITTVNAASGTFTISPASLASSSSWTAGRESTAVALTSIDPLVDVWISGKITTGTSPTVSTIINIYVYAAINTTPDYPDVFDGTDSAETVTSENVRNAAIRFATCVVVDNTSDRTYFVAPFSLREVFGGNIPSNFGLFIAHNTAVNLNSTAGNHAFYYTPEYRNVAQS